ncbi:anthranilate 1,2-dioxygenase electron transfer component AntC [Paraburkholderia caffeinilytica]|uniref:anthranilate 1,2-dioxygenase electron transfer component AntC n=1 Tax=Paraburkholderia caffeinilytica TaxID=1761016 RepID=UPI0038B7CDB1
MMHKVALNFADGKSVFFNIRENEVLLDAALKNGVKIPLDCREGVCGTCQGLCESGVYSQDYVDEETLSPDDLKQRKILSCQTRVKSDASFYFDFDSTLLEGKGTSSISGRVKKVELVSPTTAILHLDASGHAEQLDFHPGQYARLKVPDTEEWRSYSFSNCPNAQNQLQFLIRLLENGAMSNYLRDRCKVGQTVEMEAPFGAFYMRHVERPLVMAAGGTGLSAFLGMLDQLAKHGGASKPIRLYYGVTNAADLCEVDRLRKYAESIGQYHLEIVVMRPDAGWTGRTGVIPEHFDRAFLAANEFDMYVCGPPPMVEAIKTWLVDANITGYRLFYEKFAESNTR